MNGYFKTCIQNFGNLGNRLEGVLKLKVLKLWTEIKNGN